MSLFNGSLLKVNSHNKLSSSKKKLSTHVLEVGVLLLIIGSVVLAVIDPNIRPLFLGLTTDVVIAYIQKHG
jgi:hypothetical protein